MIHRELILICLMALTGVIRGQLGQGQLQAQGQQARPVQRFINPQNGGNFAGAQRNNGQRQGQFGGPNGQNQNGPNAFGPNLRRLQPVLSGQPSLVNVGGCSVGVSLRNADGTTLVCGYGPKDFECPVGFRCTFDNGLQALICCPSGKNVSRIVGKETEIEDQPNPCPDQEPIKDEFGNRLKCDFAGGPANACPAGTLCVVGACCPVSVAGLIAVKPGQCPLPLPVSQNQNCQNDCTFDADCPGPAKCCFVGCGARCVASVGPSIKQNSPDNAINDQQLALNSRGNPDSINGPLSGNGASLSQFNLQQQAQLNRQGFGQQGFFGQQQNNAFFNQQRQQFQFPNNGPPGTFGGFRGAPGQQRPVGAQNGFEQPGFDGGFGQQQPRSPQFQSINRNRQFDQAFEN